LDRCNNEATAAVLEHLVEAMDHVPRLLQPIAAATTHFLARASSYSDCHSQLLAMYVLCQLEQQLSCIGVPTVLQTILSCCTNDDDTDWASDPVTLQDDETSYDDDDNLQFAQQLLCDMLKVCGSATLIQVLLPTVELWMNASASSFGGQWRAAVLAMQCAVEALPISFAPFRAVAERTAMDCIMTTSNNMPLRLKYDALHLLALLSHDGGALNNPAGVLEAMAWASHSPCQKVAAEACRALVSYCRPAISHLDKNESTAARVVPYCQHVLAALISGPLAAPGGVVQIRAMGAAACLAQACGSAFAPHYSTVMPGLLACCTQRVGHDEKTTFAAIEAATIIGQAVGDDEHRHLFAADAELLLQWILPMLRQQNDVQLDQVLFAACARIAGVMGDAFAVYAGAVLPHLLERVTAATDVELSVRLFVRCFSCSCGLYSHYLNLL
jgi:hypothetical protein